MTADQAIIFVRAKRPNSIQTRGQLLCVQEFTQFLTPLRNIFSCCDPKAHAVTLAQYLIRQRHLLHGYEARLLKHVPKIIHLVCKLLLDLAENRPVVMKDVFDGPGLSADIEKTVSEMVTMQVDKELLRNSSAASDPFRPPAGVAEFETQDTVLSNEQEFGPLWKRRNVECLQPLTCLKRRLSYSDSDLKRAESLLEQGETPWTGPAQVLLCHSFKQQKAIGHCPAAQSPEVDISKDASVHGTFSFWNHSKCGDMQELRDDRLSRCPRRSPAKEVQRSRTFSVGVSGSPGPGEQATPSCADGQKNPSTAHPQVAHCQCESHGGWGLSPVKEGRPFCSPLDWSSGPQVQSPGGHEAQESKDLPEAASELSVEARRILAAKALANLNEFVEKEEVKRKVEMWQVSVFHLIVYMWEVFMSATMDYIFQTPLLRSLDDVFA